MIANAFPSCSALFVTVSVALDAAAFQVPCSALNLQVLRVEDAPSQYARFCLSRPEQCDLEDEDSIMLDQPTRELVATINVAVNQEIELMPDIDCHGEEELWILPFKGYGDCEDLALEKRKRLRAAGVSSAALTMAIVHHKEQFFPHAVLLLESDGGTHVLDSLDDAILCWDTPPYEYERRERPDGSWSRFVRPN